MKEWFSQLISDVCSKYKVIAIEMSRANRKALSRDAYRDINWQKTDTDIPVLIGDLDDDTVVLTIKGAL